MTSENKYPLPSPPTFAQMMEDIEIMSSHEKIFRLSQLEETASSNENPLEETNQFLARLETLQRIDTSLDKQNDSTNDQVEKKLRDIIEQLQMCLNKLQTNSFPNTKKSLTDSRK